MSAGLLPKCCGFTTLSVPVIMLSAIKIGSDCMRNANKSPKSPYPGKGSGKVIKNLYPGSDDQQKFISSAN